MKKIIILLLTAAMIAAAFVGCADKPEKLPSDGFGLTSEDTNGNWLRDDVELEILKYQYGEKVDPKKYIVNYFGTHNNVLVLSVKLRDAMLPTVVEHEMIAGIKFSYGIGREYCVWADDKLFFLKDAYELGVFTDEDIRYIHQQYALAYHLYGPYSSGAEVFQRREDADPESIYYENIAGIELRFNSYLKFKVIYNNEFYELKEAYELGIMTAEDIESFYADYSDARFHLFDWE